MARVVDLRKGKPEVRTERKASPARRPPPREPERPVRRAPLRVRKRRKRAVVLGTIAALVGCAALAVHWVSYLPEFTIQTIDVTGTSTIAPAEIEARVRAALGEERGFISPHNIFWYDTLAIEAALGQDVLHIARARVSRADTFSNTLRVAIDERAPFARWCLEPGTCYIIDETGFIFASASSTTEIVLEPYSFEGGVPTSTDPLGQYVAPARFPSALAMLRAFGQAGFAPVRARIDSDTDLSIDFERGFSLYAAFGSEPPTLVRNLKLILGSDVLKDRLGDLEYVDLRFGNRIFYKLEGEQLVGQ